MTLDIKNLEPEEAALLIGLAKEGLRLLEDSPVSTEFVKKKSTLVRKARKLLKELTQ